MKRALLLAPALAPALALVLALAACKEELTQNTDPLALNPETGGHFCQMNLLEHEGPKGQVHLEGLPGMPFFFSQVSDLVVYLRLPEQSHNVRATVRAACDDRRFDDAHLGNRSGNLITKYAALKRPA